MPEARSGTAGRSASLWPQPTEDRRRLGTPLTVVVAVLLGISFRAALATMSLEGRGTLFIELASVTAVVATLLLRSIPLRWVVRTYSLLGAFLVIRFGWLANDPGVEAAGGAFVWAICVAVALALCPTPDTRAETAPRPGRGAQRSGPPDSSATRSVSRSVSRSADASGRRPASFGSVVRNVVAVAVLVAAVTAIVGPVAGRRAGVAPSSGTAPNRFDRGPDNALSVQETLDMTSRPRLTDAVVMTVSSPVETFWRTTTYDVWDGSTWTRRDGGVVRPVPPDGIVTASADDLAAVSGQPSSQVFRLQSRFANVLPAATSVVSVRSSTPLYQQDDGSLISPEALGKGAVYRVESRQADVTAAKLAANQGPVPDDILVRYARLPRTTQRVRDLAQSVAGDAGTQFAKVKALEDWMGKHLTYSLDAPLSPSGVDVVDDFLFRSKEGWCEQIASSLVVMLRQVGVPARLATGYAPGEWDASAGRFVVRERDAHAWAEVWFPDIGWVPFDPTASVPYAGDAHAQSPAIPIGFGTLAVVLLFVAAVVVLSGPLAERLHRWRERRRAAAAASQLAAARWDVRVERELEELGREVGRPRAPAETVSAHARELAAVTGRAELADQGAAVDDFRYAPPGSAPDTAP